MKKLNCICFSLMLLVSCAAGTGAVSTNPGEPYVSAKYAALLVAETGALLYGKEEHTQASMASTTKIMTSLLALEEKDTGREVLITDAMIRVEGTSLGLQAGDRVALKTLVYGMLLESGNDAANAAALAIDGSANQFAERMNLRAAQIGMRNTHFVTPSGLDDPAHYSTAYDMALLGAEAIRNPEFAEVCSTKQIRLTFGLPPAARTLTNHNRLLSSCEGVFGIKTGFTKKSGRCLVSAAKRNGVTLVAVTLSASNDWNDHQKLFDYGFSQVKQRTLDMAADGLSVPVIGGDAAGVSVKCASVPSVSQVGEKRQSVTRTVELPRFLYAPVKTGDLLGQFCYYNEAGKLIAQAPLVADRDIECVTQPVEPRADKEGFLIRIWVKIKQLFSGSEEKQ